MLIKVSSFHFIDLSALQPGVAAQAFYHVLALATNSLFKVKQEEAYGEIEITIV